MPDLRELYQEVFDPADYGTTQASPPIYRKRK